MSDPAYLYDKLDAYEAQNELMREAMQEFVDRCDAGSVLSKYTYAKFKDILSSASAGQSQ